MTDSPYEWIYRLYAPKPLHFAIMTKQINDNLTRSKAILLFAIRGAFEEGLLPEADYDVLKKKYSVSIPEAKALKKVTPEQLEAKAREEEDQHNYNRKMNRFFKEVLAQWSNIRKESSKQRHLENAHQHKNLKYAKLVIELAEREMRVNSS